MIKHIVNVENVEIPHFLRTSHWSSLEDPDKPNIVEEVDSGLVFFASFALVVYPGCQLWVLWKLARDNAVPVFVPVGNQTVVHGHPTMFRGWYEPIKTNVVEQLFPRWVAAPSALIGHPLPQLWILFEIAWNLDVTVLGFVIY